MAQMVKMLDKLVMAGALFGLVLAVAPVWASQTSRSSSAASAHATPGYLGIYLRSENAQSAHGRKRSHTKGAEILGVDRDAPAGKVGLQPHDIVEGVNGHPISSAAQLRDMLHGMRAGRTIHLKISRKGKPMVLSVKLASRAEVEASAWPEGVIFADGFPVSGAGGMANELSQSNLGPGVRLREFVMLGCDGLDVEPIGKQLAAYFGVPQGAGLLVRNVAPHSVAASAGLQAGDVITAANGMPSNSLRGWLMVVSQNQGKTVKLKVIRNHKEKVIQYMPGGHRQQSRLTMPERLRGGSVGFPSGESSLSLSWIWTAIPVGHFSLP